MLYRKCDFAADKTDNRSQKYYGDIEDEIMETAAADTTITEAEAKYAGTGKLYDAREEFRTL